ncbi:allantoinase AllB [Staphylococcus gallinarum]|jgi:allantoinase|uniref:allantoinase AllB n=1 Tax=Staphylococcus gallinarum TaxID=1293 RepID=UPI000D1CEC47|nr:allantoinase AllB [Staphylococcus gallinarum]MCD8820816.1 allantoinase AllB [Staphylococcus gallinarum]MCD8826264.1 allantoinase AllB [Staphylococcus gallinarum]MEB6242506.1 allantoinase AllB [Staphylococcus gallinarum]MEB6295686.1 allantoinase AllB [Staphylococcus gallinarum]PTE79872.1 allantoinase AllB [Staphylococcus gallinarum]
MKFDLIIKNGLVILENGEQNVEVGVKDGKIAAIGHDLGEATKVIDAENQIVSPGMVDAHVHITEPGGGYRDGWEGYETGTKAAAKGGVTSFIEMPLNQVPATTDKASIEVKFEAGKDELAVDVASYGGLVPYNLNGGIQELDEAGVIGYKAFIATCGDRSIEGDFQDVDDYSLYEGMKQIAKTGKILSIHSENAAITDRLGQIAKDNGETTLSAYVDTRPVFTEVEPIRKIILFAKETGCRVHIVHVACEEGVDEVVKAQQEGVDITCETCTHYLYFYKEELDDIGPVVKCSPPIREKSRLEGMWNRVLNGDIGFVTSDHSPCTPDLKATDNAFEAWGGIAGLQNNVDVLYDEGVQKRNMTLKRFAEIIATEPAKRFGMYDKGSIEIGKDADFVFIKPDSPYTLTEADLEYRNKMSPYLGREIGAQVTRTILRGQEIYNQETGVADIRSGRFINY